jgi:hypothetical protein
MSFYVEASETSFKPVPAGMHLARLYRIIDLGTQKSEFEGNVNFLHKIKFVWEVHGEDESGQALVTDKNEPMIITKDYTLSWGDKANLRKDLEAWRGVPFTEEERRRFDLKSVLDKWCMLNVQHKPRQKGGVYANVVGITPVPKVIKTNGLPKGHNKCEIFIISEGDMEMFNTFGEYLKKTIQSSPEWQGLAKKGNVPAPQSSGFDDIEDDIPF